MDDGTVNIPHGQTTERLPEIYPAGLPRSEAQRLAPSYITTKQPRGTYIDIRPPLPPEPPPPPKPATFNEGQLKTVKMEPAKMATPSISTPQPSPSNQSITPAPSPSVPPSNSGQVTSAGFNAAPTAKRTNVNSTQNSLQIAEIRDGIVIMNDGTFRSVVMAKSINFDLMSPQEQEGVEIAYQGFLNSLYFPVEIFVRSQKVDLGPYIEKLDRIKTEHDNMLLIMLMEDYINFIDQLSQQTNIMDKKFYVVVPFFPQVDAQKALDQSKTFLTGLSKLFSSQEKHVVVNERDLENAKTELRNRVNAVMSGLLQCGVQALPLDTQELIELYYDTYNPDTATRQGLKDFSSLTANVVEKGVGQAPQAHLRSELN